MPAASTILMVRPAAFGFNEETAVNNYFQSRPSCSQETLQEKAKTEFDNLVRVLRTQHIRVIVIEDDPVPARPDALFPNNWFSTFPNGTIAVYPLFSPSRRPERRKEILDQLQKEFSVKEIQDWSNFEKEERFLEGTGSMVIDHENKMIYASISERTSLSVLEKFAKANGYQAMVFIATDRNGRPIYHTNVMMTLGEKFCVLCEEAIDEEWELIAVRQLLEATHHVIIPITRQQMHHFAGNMLELKNEQGDHFLVLSQAAFESLGKEQRNMLDAFAKLLPVAVPTIEQVEGGSVRCMMAEIFLPAQSDSQKRD